MFGILATPLGFIMRLIYNVIQNYGWTIILFTLLTRILMFPLNLKQQKSTARMSAYQPMIMDIQKKWANDKNKQNEEMQKFYSENNISMTAGCLPMLVNMLVIFGIIAVIQAPMKYILDIPTEQVDIGQSIVEQNLGDDQNVRAYTLQSIMIGDIKENGQTYIDGGMDAEVVEKISDFNFEFLGMNLSGVPSFTFNKNLIFPILSVLTMFMSQFIVMKASGNAATAGKSMMVMTVFMGVMFGFIAFTIPIGFSLYYTVSNIIMTFQQLILKKIYNPDKIREEIEQEMEERKKAKKAKKKVVVQTDSGEEIEKEVSESELAKLRLAKARELDRERYGDLRQESFTEDEEKAREKAKKQDSEKYSLADEKPSGKKDKQKEESGSDTEAEKDIEAEEKEQEAAKGTAEDDKSAPQLLEESEQEQETEEQDPAEEEQEESAKEYKPGRRKRARMKKEELSFAEKEALKEKEMDDKESGKGE